MKISLKQLQLFVAVVKCDNLSLGAQAVFLSQPAASNALAELEAQLGTLLFDRRGKRLILNENGSSLYSKAVEMIDRAYQIESLFSHQGATVSGHVRIGTSSTIGNYVMPPLIAKFISRYPHIKITQKVTNSETIIRDLEKFNLDVGFIESECHSDVLNTELWGVDELIIFAAKQHPLASKKQVTRVQLEQAEWVLRERGSGTREALERFFYPKKVRLEVGSTQAIKKIVADSSLLSCASRYTLLEELQQGRLVELKIKSWPIQREFFRLIHKDRYHTDLIELFLSSMR